MSNATEVHVQVGDKVIYVENANSKPVETTVTRVTPTGQIQIACTPKENWKLYPYASSDGPCYESVRKEKMDPFGGRYSDRCVYLWSREKWDELMKKAADWRIRQEQEKQRRQREMEENDRRKRMQLEEVRKAMPADSVVLRTLPDGSRLLEIDLPIKPEYADQKKGFEHLIIRLRDEKTGDEGGAKRRVSADWAGFHCGRCGFTTGMSGYSNYISNEEAIWDVIRRRYNNKTI